MSRKFFRQSPATYACRGASTEVALRCRPFDKTTTIEEEMMAFAWEKNPDEAIAQAKTNGKLVILDFSAAPA